jgi:hypothetical protein
MLQFNLLLEKLRHHKSDLELMISIHNTHSCTPSDKLNRQYNQCLMNIQVYESLIKEKATVRR